MKALITGGAGFIGGYLAQDLIDFGHEVVIADNFSRGVEDGFLKDLESRGANLVTVDLLDPSSLKTLGGGYDCIFHLAAIIGVENVMGRPYDVLRKNAELLFNLIDFAHMQTKLSRFVFASTSEVYAGTLQFFDMAVPTPEDTPLTITPLEHPRTSYMLSKIYGEASIRQSGLPFTIVRPHNFYGPRMGMSHVVPELLKKAHTAPQDGTLEVFSVDHRRTFCYISDAVTAMRLLAENDNCAGEVFNIGNQAPEIAIGDLAKIVLKVTGRDDLTIAPLPATSGSPTRRCPNTQRMTAATEFEPLVSIEDGVRATYSWYRDHIFEGTEISAK